MNQKGLSSNKSKKYFVLFIGIGVALGFGFEQLNLFDSTAMCIGVGIAVGIGCWLAIFGTKISKK